MCIRDSARTTRRRKVPPGQRPVTDEPASRKGPVLFTVAASLRPGSSGRADGRRRAGLEALGEDAQVRLDDFAPAILAGGAFLARHFAQGGPDRVGTDPTSSRHERAEGSDADELIVAALRE